MILEIRGKSVIIDRDLASLYDVTTKRLNEQVKRNKERFPEDFIFQITKEEKAEVVANCDHLQAIKYSNNLPYVFTEHGAIMAASVLRSEIAANVSVHVVRAFIQMREELQNYSELSKQVDHLEEKYDAQFAAVFAALRELIDGHKQGNESIGFRLDGHS